MPVHHRLRLLAFPTRASSTHDFLARPGVSRFPHKERPHMPGSMTAPRGTGARACAPVLVAFRSSHGVGSSEVASFAAQWLAYVLPCRRFALTLAGNNARLGVDVDRYSFIAVDLHHLLLAGIPAHAKRNPGRGLPRIPLRSMRATMLVGS